MSIEQLLIDLKTAIEENTAALKAFASIDVQIPVQQLADAIVTAEKVEVAKTKTITAPVEQEKVKEVEVLEQEVAEIEEEKIVAITFEQVRTKIRELATFSRATAEELLSNYNVSQIGKLKEDQYALAYEEAQKNIREIQKKLGN